MSNKQELGEKVVCVSGGSGYIASWIVKLLLQRGYTVKASVRSLNDPKKTQHLMSLDGAKERLHLLEADLLQEGSFDSLVEGCLCVFHTASPVFFSAVEPQVELIEPAVNGTLNVLRSCTKFPSTKRVVLMFSMAAVIFKAKSKMWGLDIIVDESWFSDPTFCEKLKAWYELSKTLAEEAAWKFAKENGIDLVTINPDYVIGPLLQPTINASSDMILRLINRSSKTFPNFVYQCVHVGDVAMAHVLALEVPSANGRYCLVGHVLHYAQLLDIVKQLYPSLPVALKCENEVKPLKKAPKVSKEKAKSLGIEFTSVEVILRDTIESLKEKGFLNI